MNYYVINVMCEKYILKRIYYTSDPTTQHPNILFYPSLKTNNFNLTTLCTTRYFLSKFDLSIIINQYLTISILFHNLVLTTLQ